MSFYNKYLKYKNKYIQLKNNQTGGVLTSYRVVLNPTVPVANQITLSYDLDLPLAQITTIRNFNINIGGSDIQLLYKNFMVNKNFLYDYLDLKKDKDNMKLKEFKNKIQQALASQYIENNVDAKIANYIINNPVDYNFNDCESIIITDDYLKLNDKDTDIKRFIESYFRKSICIMTQKDNFIQSQLKNYHNLLQLYYSLIIISQYFKIVFKKSDELRVANLDPERLLQINKKYSEIYKNIPKYIPLSIGLDQIEMNTNNPLIFRKLNETHNGINDKMIIKFDTGNSSVTIISHKLLRYLGYYDAANNPDPALENTRIFSNFIRPSAVGAHGGFALAANSNLILIQFRFVDNKLNNDKTYNLYCYPENNPGWDILFGQQTLHELFEDGYSIKYSDIKFDGEREMNKIKDLYKILNSANSPILTALQNSHPEINFNQCVNYIMNFSTGFYIQKSNLNVEDIIRIKKEISAYIQYIQTNHNSKLESFYNLLITSLGLPNATPAEKAAGIAIIRTMYP
jgi:hypothetical protein